MNVVLGVCFIGMEYHPESASRVWGKKLREDGGRFVTARSGWLTLEMIYQRSTEMGGEERERESSVRLRSGSCDE